MEHGLVNIAGISIGPGQPCRFVAEMSCAHSGNELRAHHIIDAAKEAGADFLKLQCYTPQELVELRGDGPAPSPWGDNGWTMRSLYERAQTPHAWFPELVAHCNDIGLPWFSSVFGLESLALLESLGCPAYKIAALDNHHADLIQACHATGKPVLVSTRKPSGTGIPVEWLYCPPGYPTRAEDVSLPPFGWLGEADGYLNPCIGLSSHCLDPLLPVAAVARGAKVIEMHMMLDDEPSELEANVSLTASQFRAMVESVRRVEVLLGSEGI